MEVKIYKPHPALQTYVSTILTIDVTLPEGIMEVVTPYPPSPFQSIMFYCNDPISMGRIGDENFHKQPLTLLTGPQISRVNVKVHKQLKSVRVDFLPGAMYRLLGIPMNELFDGGFDANDIFGSELKSVNDQLQQLYDLEACKIIVEQFLLSRTKNVKALLPFDSALLTMLKHEGNISIEKTASFSCLSLKQFERKCQERLGMNPKLYSRILKFSKAYRLHEAFPYLSWIQIAYEAGYYDQMHMIRDFKVFAGVNPSVIAQQLISTPLRMQRDMRY
ncbi:helix-turn-helix domain-containing protein [Dyadobacter psychrotolerans]|uniref:AraC family transcriptional regulator n=1 Tax=Dyadobacter psychrotolerans TaxID=2541721 RepID=A0A4R5DMX2_9BACT|nr:AraC family transcriptional regulator [Dyadobacter psychrotolerans]TDE15652.1 AraC family transcriptional regulator [Dyadobacter psychrotolerans]